MSQTFPANTFGPDFKKMAHDFDRFMGLIKPVGDAIIKNMTNPKPGSTVLDVACGTGEPGITLARARGDLRITGIDSIEKMISNASIKSSQENLSNISFAVMQAEKLQFADESFDHLISRFGLGMFGDTVQSINEGVRVLKQQGQFSLAVWHDMSKNTLVKIIVEDLKAALQAELPEEFAKMFDKGPGAGAVQNLKNAGCKTVESEEFTWFYRFDSAEHLREFLRGPATMMFGKILASMAQEESEALMNSVSDNFSAFRKLDGIYEVPHTCQLIFGHK